MNNRVYAISRPRSIRERLSSISTVGLLIIITTLISMIEFTLLVFSSCDPQSTTCWVLDYFALKPSNILAGKYLWTLVLHIFSHGGAVHLLVNMFVLFSLGGLCEKIIGRKRFLWFYIISGVFAGLLSVVLSILYGNTLLGAKIFGDPSTYMLGASGAIFAIAGLFVMLLPRLRFSIIFLPFFSLPAYIMVPLVLILTWVATLASNLPIGNVAHFGGFIAGIAYGFYLKTKYRKKVMMLQQMFK
ncbi:rhomboid family intramembrane serine protease [Candidatus Pacearchaeota archaeon]|nr:rhomboid family intramembrane serine protease [Candidatus Pacearchaeota archaeon]